MVRARGSRRDSLDSLDSVELEALLQSKGPSSLLPSKGPLSRWPTPPPSPKKETIVEVVEVFDEDSKADYGVEIGVGLDYTTHVHLLVAACRHSSRQLPGGLTTLAQVLNNIPPHFLPLALNILREFERCYELNYYIHHYQHPAIISDPNNPLDKRTPGNLLVIAAIILSYIHYSDHTPSTFWWAKMLCQGLYTVREFDRAVLNLLCGLGRGVVALSLAEGEMEEARRELFGGSREEFWARWRFRPWGMVTGPLIVNAKYDAAMTAGQITPPDSAVDAEGDDRKNRFLRLL